MATLLNDEIGTCHQLPAEVGDSNRHHAALRGVEHHRTVVVSWVRVNFGLGVDDRVLHRLHARRWLFEHQDVGAFKRHAYSAREVLDLHGFNRGGVAASCESELDGRINIQRL